MCMYVYKCTVHTYFNDVTFLAIWSHTQVDKYYAGKC